MNVHISCKTGKTPDVERELKHQIEKLERRLQVFKPDLMHLHAVVEPENGHRTRASLNLRLPSGQLAAQKSGENVLAAIKNGFAELVSQVNKHKDLLRGERKWRGRRDAKRQAAPESTLSTHSARQSQVEPAIEPKSAIEISDVNSWINANIHRLEGFVDREIRYWQATGQIGQDQVSREEVIDEVMVGALSREEEKPEGLSLESWLYRLALQALRQLAQANADTAAISLDAPVGVQNVTGSDENLLQFHQPDDSLSEESVIQDAAVRTPEEIFASEEMVFQLDSILRKVHGQDREAFVLYALEGFTLEEIARISDVPPDHVRQAIARARDQIRRDLPANDLRRSLLRHSLVA